MRIIKIASLSESPNSIADLVISNKLNLEVVRKEKTQMEMPRVLEDISDGQNE